jgi:hypothetical protein
VFNDARLDQRRPSSPARGVGWSLPTRWPDPNRLPKPVSDQRQWYRVGGAGESHLKKADASALSRGDVSDRFYQMAFESCLGRRHWISLHHTGRSWTIREAGPRLFMTSSSVRSGLKKCRAPAPLSILISVCYFGTTFGIVLAHTRTRLRRPSQLNVTRTRDRASDTGSCPSAPTDGNGDCAWGLAVWRFINCVLDSREATATLRPFRQLGDRRISCMPHGTIIPCICLQSAILARPLRQSGDYCLRRDISADIRPSGRTGPRSRKWQRRFSFSLRPRIASRGAQWCLNTVGRRGCAVRGSRKGLRRPRFSATKAASRPDFELPARRRR